MSAGDDIFSGVTSGLLGLGASIVGANESQNAQNKAEQNQQALQTAAFNQQAAYIAQQEAAQRGVLQGISSQGNPYFNAAQSLPKPTFAAGGQFGPGPTPGGPAAPAPNPMAAGASLQAPPAQAPAPQSAMQGAPGAASAAMLPPGGVQRPPMAQGASQAQAYPPGMRRTA